MSMDDLNALCLIRAEKEKYTSFTEKLKSGEDILLYNEDVQSTTERSVKLCTDVQRYINAIQDEIQSLNDKIKSFTIHLGEKMKQLVESGYFEETNSKMFKSGDKDKKVITSVLQFIGIKPSVMSSGDTKARQDARKGYDAENARLLLEYEKIANQQHNLQLLLNQTENVIAKARTDVTVTNTDVNDIASALKKWSNSLENAKEQKRRKAKEEEERRRREEERRKREREREEAERKRQEENERKRKEEEERKRREEEERKRKEEEEREKKKRKNEKDKKRKSE